MSRKGSQRYYYFETFKLQSNTQQLQCVHEYILWKYPTKKKLVIVLYNARPHLPRIMQVKNILFRLDCSTPSSLLIRHCAKWFSSFFSSTIRSEWQFFFQDQTKRFVINYLSSKLPEDYKRENNKVPDKWREVTQYNGENNIDWHYLIIHEFT